MTPRELKSLMARTHSSSLMLGEALGISPVQIRKWRGGARPIPEYHLDKIEAFFRDRGARPPETPRTIDPRAIPQLPSPIALRLAHAMIRCRRPTVPRSLKRSTG
jgi:hypothetical protein